MRNLQFQLLVLQSPSPRPVCSLHTVHLPFLLPTQVCNQDRIWTYKSFPCSSISLNDIPSALREEGVHLSMHTRCVYHYTSWFTALLDCCNQDWVWTSMYEKWLSYQLACTKLLTSCPFKFLIKPTHIWAVSRRIISLNKRLPVPPPDYAERVGFEPTEQLPVLQISSLTQSTNSAISPFSSPEIPVSRYSQFYAFKNPMRLTA